MVRPTPLLASLSRSTLRSTASSSIARRPVFALTPAATSSLHTSTRLLLATPHTGPQRVTPGPIATPLGNKTTTLDASAPGSRHVGETEPGSGASKVLKEEYEDYSKGPSALDKAAQMFFFTEILRGE